MEAWGNRKNRESQEGQENQEERVNQEEQENQEERGIQEDRENSLKLLSFWAINGELCGSELRRQLDEMKSLGMQGTIFHPRY